MKAASPADLELSTGKAWLGLQPNMTRGEVMAVVAAAGVRTSDDDTNPAWLLLEDDWGIELTFETGGAQRLRQLSRDEGDLTWHGKPLMGEPLHEAWEVMQAETEGAGWSPEDAVADSIDSPSTSRQGPVSDEQLLSNGTLWLPKVGLGLIMYDGVVLEIACRRKEDLPSLIGPVTTAQLSLSQSPDLDQILRKRLRPAAATPAFITTSWTPLQWLLAVAFWIAMGTVAKLGFDETRAWQQATVLDGKLTAFEPQPGKTKSMGYRVRYIDPYGKSQQIVLEAADFYVAPREVGDEVQVSYVDGNPPKVKGPSRARDAAFLHYVPWAIAILLSYMVANMTAGWWGQRNKQAAGSPKGPPASGPGGTPPGGPEVKVV